MPKILYLCKDQTDSFNFKRALRQANNMADVFDEMTPGGVMPRLAERTADILIISDGVLGQKTADFVKIIREKLGWFLQVPIFVLVSSEISQKHEADLYKAGVNFVSKNTNVEIYTICNMIESLHNYTIGFKKNNPYAVGAGV